jgi:glycosyltransferase involved in cell wall biosynthesis
MVKVLVLTYFFPPCTLTASTRIKLIVENLAREGYYPIVVTRNWDLLLKNPSDALKSCGNRVLHIKYDNYEVYYLPYRSSLRDKFYIISESFFLFSIISKFLTLISSLSEPFFDLFIPFSNLYTFSKKVIKKEKDIKLLFTSANPFILFKYCFLINKKFSIPWIADYRDAWTTNEMSKQERGIYKFIYKLQSIYEKKWVSSALFFSTVSNKYLNNISKFVKKDGVFFYNGINDLKEQIDVKKPLNKVKIFYSGTLYSNQDVESFLKTIFELNKEFPDEFEVVFAGLGYNKIQKQRVTKSLHYCDNILIYEWLDKSNLQKLLEQSDLLLMLSYKGFDGIPTSKLFEYLSFNKPVLLFPSDNGIIENILRKVGNHPIVNLKIELYEFLKSYKESNGNINGEIFKINEKKINEFSTYAQMSILIDKIKSCDLNKINY